MGHLRSLGLSEVICGPLRSFWAISGPRGVPGGPRVPGYAGVPFSTVWREGGTEEE